MFLVAGLGNPGPKYADNRHNVGFMVADRLVERAADPGTGFRGKLGGEMARVRLGREDCVVLKPMTYMNLSGESVQKAMQFFKIPLPELIVVHDELDLPFGSLRVKVGGGLAGHNGLRSIAQHCGGNGFVRLRMGIGRPTGKQSVEKYVLSDFDASERAELGDLLDRAVDALEAVATKGPEGAMNALHGAGKGKGTGKGRGTGEEVGG